MTPCHSYSGLFSVRQRSVLTHQPGLKGTRADGPQHRLFGSLWGRRRSVYARSELLCECRDRCDCLGCFRSSPLRLQPCDKSVSSLLARYCRRSMRSLWPAVWQYRAVPLQPPNRLESRVPSHDRCGRMCALGAAWRSDGPVHVQRPNKLLSALPSCYRWRAMRPFRSAMQLSNYRKGVVNRFSIRARAGVTMS